MKQLEILDISGDAGIRAFGRDLPDLFVKAATGICCCAIILLFS